MFQELRSFFKPGDVLYVVSQHGLKCLREPYIVLKEPYLVASEETSNSKYMLNLITLKKDRYISLYNISFWEEWIVREQQTTNNNKETDNA